MSHGEHFLYCFSFSCSHMCLHRNRIMNTDYKILFGKDLCWRKIRKKYIPRDIVLFCTVIWAFLLDFHAKMRKFDYSSSTSNLNCTKTVTDRNIGVSPLVYICHEDVSIEIACFSNTNCICKRRFMTFFPLYFVTCLR